MMNPIIGVGLIMVLLTIWSMYRSTFSCGVVLGEKHSWKISDDGESAICTTCGLKLERTYRWRVVGKGATK